MRLPLRDLYLPVLACGLFLLVVMLVTDQYLSRLLALIAFWACIGMSWNLIGGYAGQLSLGHAAFIGLGGYIALVLQQEFGINPWIGLAVSTVVATLAALVVGAPTLRLSGVYFSLATMVYPLILQVLFTYWGYQEALIPAHPENPFLFMQWRDLRWYGWLFGIALALCWIATVMLERSHWRYQLFAVREDEAAAEAVGINTWKVKLWAFIVSGAIAGALGVVYAQMLYVVTPESMFGLGLSVQPLVINLVGGLGHPVGPLLGTLITVPLSQALDAYFGAISGAAQLVYGFVLIVVILVIPRGLIDALGVGKVRALAPVATVAPARTRQPQAGAAPPPGEVLLAADGLAKNYGGVIALKGVSLTVRAHEFLGIVGPNGAGKTTFFDLLTGFQRPSAGRLRLRGSDVTAWKPHRLARLGMARTFQVPRPFGRLTVYENALLGCLVGEAHSAADREERIRNTLEAVGLGALSDKPANSLGPSQLRLLEVARALVARPSILLLDEPLAGLDHAEIAELIAILRAQQANGLTILLVDHAIGTVASVVDRLAVLDNGVLIADGAPAEVTRMPRVVEAYLGQKWDHAGH